MNSKDFNQVFSTKLRQYMSEYNMTQAELAKRLSVGATSVYNWYNAVKTPRMDKVDRMCEIFHCNRSDLIEDRTEEARAEDFKSPAHKKAHGLIDRMSESEAQAILPVLEVFQARKESH